MVEPVCYVPGDYVITLQCAVIGELGASADFHVYESCYMRIS